MKFDKTRLLKNIGIGTYNFKAKPVIKENLTADKMRDLFGSSYKQVVCFDYLSGNWNRDKYLGFSMGNQSIDTAHAMELRRIMQYDERMSGFELAAIVSMSVPDEQYPGTGCTTSNKLSYKRSRNIVATIILRDKLTGNIVQAPNVWIGVDRYDMMSAAAFYGADAFVYKMANNYHMRKKFMDSLIYEMTR